MLAWVSRGGANVEIRATTAIMLAEMAVRVNSKVLLLQRSAIQVQRISLKR